MPSSPPSAYGSDTKMSMDAGALAQMNYGPMSPGEIGAPSAGFATRGKGTGLKRLNLAAISENPTEGCQTPRTSRSHLLAGLRTAPKTPGPPASAPLNNPHQRHGLNLRMDSPSNEYPRHQFPQMPHTAAAAHFPQSSQNYGMQNAQQGYAAPEQVLAPPSMSFTPEDQETDPNLVAQLLATEAYLNQRQQQLQQQLLSLTSQQFGGMSFTSTPRGNYGGAQVNPQMSFYAQQLQNGVSPIPQEIPGRPGVYLVYNPMTGQYTYAVDPTVQQQQVSSPVPQTPNHGYFGMATDRLRHGQSPVDATCTSPFGRGPTPPKHTPSPTLQAVAPPPGNSMGSNSALRRNHKKLASVHVSSPSAFDPPRSARPNIPQTPMTGTFGPGQNRAGEHPIRQPRGPPPMEELKAAPTTKHEGSKNFATRQRRKAVSSLVRRGVERRGAGSSHGSIGGGSAGSIGSSTPVSETEMTFSVPSSDGEHDHTFDGDGYGDDSYSDAGTGRTSDKSSHGSLRAAAIGAERKEKLALDAEAAAMAAAVERLELKSPPGEQRRQMPFMLLERAEKRKSYCG